jgi:hypothetical protein
MEAPIYSYSQTTLDVQYPQSTAASRAIPIVRPVEELEQVQTSYSSEAESPHADRAAQDPQSWARIDDDDDDNEDTKAQGSITNGHRLRDTLDPFDDDEFNPFAPPSASDLEVLNGARNIPYGSYHSSTDLQSQPQQYPPTVFYSTDEGYGGPVEDGLMSPPMNLDQDMTPLEMLVQIIKDVSPEKIEQAFAKTGYDFERTLETLLTARSSGNAELVIPLMGNIRSTQTCRHFLQGNCFRKDCWYSHDLDSMVCKFW